MWDFFENSQELTLIRGLRLIDLFSKELEVSNLRVVGVVMALVALEGEHRGFGLGGVDPSGLRLGYKMGLARMVSGEDGFGEGLELFRQRRVLVVGLL